jgi:hypothetical protein
VLCGLAQAGWFCARRAAFARLEESKVVSLLPLMFYHRVILRIFFGALIASFLFPHSSYAQAPFTLTPGTLSPAAVDPGGVSTAVVNLDADTSVGSVSLSCAVTTSLSTTAMPTCLISPSTATPNAVLSLTVTALGASPAGQYSITVTGTAAGFPTQNSTPLFLNVVEAEQNYALTVTRAINPGTVSPGGVAQATVTITPISGYSGAVVLSCLSVTPTVVASPYCSFLSNTTPPQLSVQVSSGTPATATMTISTYGTQQTTAELFSPRIFSTFWLGVPGLVLAGFGVSRRGKRNLLALFGALMVAAASLLLPACGGITPTSNNTLGYITPKNTYMLTITGVDQNGVSPSNTGTQATVSLVVN